MLLHLLPRAAWQLFLGCTDNLMLKCSAFAGQREQPGGLVCVTQLSTVQVLCFRGPRTDISAHPSPTLASHYTAMHAFTSLLSLPCSSPQTGLYLFSASYPPFTKDLLNSLLNPPPSAVPIPSVSFVRSTSSTGSAFILARFWC